MTGAVISWTRRFIHVYVCVCIQLHKAAGSWCLQGRKESREREREITKGKSQSLLAGFFLLTCTSCADIYAAAAHITERITQITPATTVRDFTLTGDPLPCCCLFCFLSPPACSRQKREEEEEESYQNSVDKNSDNNAIEREREMYTVRVKFDC